MTRTVNRTQIGLGSLLGLIVIAALVAMLFVNSIARRGIQAGAEHALGVPTTVRTVDIGLLGGRMELAGIEVQNPSGYSGPHFLALGESRIGVTLASLTRDTIIVPEFRLTGVDVVLERRDGKANYDVLLANIRKVSGPSDPSREPGPQKKLIIKDLVIRNVTIHADLIGAPGEIGQALKQVGSLTIPIEEIRLQNVGQTGTGVGGTGVTVGQLAGLIVEAVLAAAVEKGGGILPPDVLNDIKGGLNSLPALGAEGVKVIQGAANKAVESAAEQARKAAEDAAKKGAEKLGEGLKDLLGGNK
jgi:hypothetical protein